MFEIGLLTCPNWKGKMLYSLGLHFDFVLLAVSGVSFLLSLLYPILINCLYYYKAIYDQ
jgi:hypothetical protein